MNHRNETNKFIRAHHRKKRWYQIVTCLAAVVVFCTTYALILPAITMERKPCEIPEHLHDISCYSQLTSVVRTEPACTVEGLNLHRHEKSCYDENGKIICGYADFVVHEHNESCYDENGNLWCPLPEIKEHIHDSNCFVQQESTHTEHIHSPECYIRQRGACVCGREETEGHTHSETCYAPVTVLQCDITESAGHSHGPECYVQNTVLVCQTPEGEGHWHNDGCNDENGNLVCMSEEYDGHYHDSSCYETYDELVCPLAEEPGHVHGGECYRIDWELLCPLTEEPSHIHTDDCYEWEEVLSCGQPEDSAAVPAEPEPICGKEEIILHEHKKECLDEEYHSYLVCGMRQVTEHVHSDSCFQTVEEPLDTEALTCSLAEDENHTHGALCFGTWERTCPLEEHVHSKECQPDSELTEEERKHVLDMIDRIACLPSPEEIHQTRNDFENTGDTEGEKAWLEEIRTQVASVYEEYEALSEEQKAEVTNADKLLELKELLSEPEEPQYVSLTGDNAKIAYLQAAGNETIPEDEAEQRNSGTVCRRDSVSFGFSGETESYTEEEFNEGRIKLEFVLPLTEEQAVFDLPSMPWLDESEGYEPVIEKENRLLGNKEVPCQVLTGYRLLADQDESCMIPGGFSGNVTVDVQDMTPGDSVFVQISAAMECSTWEGRCEEHQIEEKLTVISDVYTVVSSLSDEELEAIYKKFLEEVEALEALGSLDDNSSKTAQDLLKRLKEAYERGELSEKAYLELSERVNKLLSAYTNSVAEAATGSNWAALRDSGWFEAYSSCAYSDSFEVFSSDTMMLASSDDAVNENSTVPPSDVQVNDRGGTNTSDDGAVSVSKTISGTDLENVFDITLQVQTSMNVAEIREEPDMAVVIVMDISNTMNSNFGGVTRYAAAMDSAESFLDQFAENNSLGISKVGYVAFNTNAHQIFGLQACSDKNQAAALKNIMRTQTGAIINASGYSDAHSRFTNVEAGLAMASDMLNGVTNQNKYIIFLSDGFPTTYISSGYSGYDPYDSTGRFYDHVLNKKCLYGTSYSDEAAIRARNKANAIKSSGTTIFSIGVDVAGQTIQKYVTQSESADGFSVVDRTGTTYEIGDASSTEAYKNWLRNSIGSGYYYDSTDSSGLLSAYEQIFAEIKHRVEAGSVADWVTSDPIPSVGGVAGSVEFIGFYNKTPELISGDLAGAYVPDGENTAAFDAEKYAISWDLKQSGYQTFTSGSTTFYTYQLVYRVRLKNETDRFAEETVYPTNDTTTLQYRTIEGTDGNLTVSGSKTIEYPIPSVQGYLADLQFTKVNEDDFCLKGAEFTLRHDTENCSICRGDGSSVSVRDKVSVSDENGAVILTNIPSGHRYVLTETKIPDGHSANGNAYLVSVDYDKVTVSVTNPDGDPVDWNGKVINHRYYELPHTGGSGTIPYTIGGILLTGSAGILLLDYKKCRKEERKAS